jgi:hypothetical protein
MLRVMPKPKDSPHDWNEPPKDWAEEQAHRVAMEVRRLRGKRSAQWLSDRTDELGQRVSRSVISDLELGRRRYVTTAELIILSAALATSPVGLIFPGPYDRTIDLIPSEQATELDAVEWFSGLQNIYRDDKADVIRNTQSLAKSRHIATLQTTLDAYLMLAGELTDQQARAMADLRRQIDQLRSELRADDGGQAAAADRAAWKDRS